MNVYATNHCEGAFEQAASSRSQNLLAARPAAGQGAWRRQCYQAIASTGGATTGETTYRTAKERSIRISRGAVGGKQMLGKLEKRRRILRWRYKPSAHAPVFWHTGRPNFGDDINPSFLHRVSGQPLRLVIDRSQPHLLGVGSILRFATPDSIVLGSGYLHPDSGALPQGTRVIGLRGQLSQQRARCGDDILLGDPLVLVDQLFDQPAPKRHRLGFVSHVLNVSKMKARFGRDVHLIIPSWEPWRVVEEIASCQLVASQSLHGLIVADALQIPNLWIAPSSTMAGGRFKFDDYFSTLDEPKQPVAATDDVFRFPEKYPFAISQFRYSKREYAAALSEAIRGFAANHGASVRAAA